MAINMGLLQEVLRTETTTVSTQPSGDVSLRLLGAIAQERDTEPIHIAAAYIGRHLTAEAMPKNCLLDEEFVAPGKHAGLRSFIGDIFGAPSRGHDQISTTRLFEGFVLHKGVFRTERVIETTEQRNGRQQVVARRGSGIMRTQNIAGTDTSGTIAMATVGFVHHGNSKDPDTQKKLEALDDERAKQARKDEVLWQKTISDIAAPLPPLVATIRTSGHHHNWYGDTRDVDIIRQASPGKNAAVLARIVATAATAYSIDLSGL